MLDYHWNYFVLKLDLLKEKVVVDGVVVDGGCCDENENGAYCCYEKEMPRMKMRKMMSIAAGILVQTFLFNL